MALSPEERAGLGVAFNEARWQDVRVDEAGSEACITLECLRLPPEGPPPEDSRVQVVLYRVGRVCVVYRSGDGTVVPLGLAQLAEAVGRCGRLPVYGWEFFDLPFERPSAYSLDVRLAEGGGGAAHRIHLFQEGGPGGELDLWIWFDELSVRTMDGRGLSLADFIASGKRWWDGFYAGDPRTMNRGLMPLKGGE